MPNPCAHAHKLSFLEHPQKFYNKYKMHNYNYNNYNIIMQMYIIIIPRKMASNQALPGPSTSGFSSPFESP